MSLITNVSRSHFTSGHTYTLVALCVMGLAVWKPAFALETVWFVMVGMVHVLPLVLPGIALAAWIVASGASGRVTDVFQGRTAQTVTAATLVGAALPVCGVTVLPLMAGLLRAGVPLAPVMAFWLASPITGPAMLSATVATLGWGFGVGKALAAVALGLFGGVITAVFAGHAGVQNPLRRNGLVGSPGCSSACDAGPEDFDPLIWQNPARRTRFWRECWSIARLILLVLTPAFAAEFLLNAWLAPDAVAAYIGNDSPFAIPLAVLVGGPAYIDGYAALPLTRALLEHGMSNGAAMAFLVSGGVVSVWGALAIFPVLKTFPFLLYLGLAATGSMAVGWAFGTLY
ncbi:MAG: permease [Pseudomonadota bacterium]